jgi:hypothetical protein
MLSRPLSTPSSIPSRRESMRPTRGLMLSRRLGLDKISGSGRESMAPRLCWYQWACPGEIKPPARQSFDTALTSAAIAPSSDTVRS